VDGKCQGDPVRFLGDCARKPSVVRDGKPYCWQHDPERLGREQRKRAAACRERHLEREAKADAAVERRVLERRAGIDDLTNSDLEVIVDAGGIRAILERLKQGA
jgi:hypothetical protein